MEFEDAGEILYANKEEGLKINFKNLKKTYTILNYAFDSKRKFGYLVQLVENAKYSLYKRERVELLTGEKSPSAYGKDANDYYAKERDLYLIKKNFEFFKFPRSSKEFIAKFSLNKQDFENYLKRNKLNFSNEEDMIKLIDLINE